MPFPLFFLGLFVFATASSFTASMSLSDPITFCCCLKEYAEDSCDPETHPTNCSPDDCQVTIHPQEESCSDMNGYRFEDELPNGEIIGFGTFEECSPADAVH